MPANSRLPPLGRVITFYSYKGGTGRSMALANAAWTLAANGMRVLMIDWDLEAPGLHRYFKPYLRDPSLEASDGLMDFVIAFADAARLPAEESTLNVKWFEAHADLRLYAYAVNGPGFAECHGQLDFVPAGRQDQGYTVRVNSFNWQSFYTKLGGGIFLEAVKRRLRAEYDYILIDSRTGVSDTSGICTVQMPDTLVVCFTLNEQSIHGAAATAVSALEQRRGADSRSTLRVMPVPTRVDSSEKDRVDAARSAARAKFDYFLDWLDEDLLDEYWGDVEMPYIPFYSLEEVLAVFDQPRVRTSLLPAVEGLVTWISEQQITALPPMDDKLRHQEKARYLRQSPQLPRPTPNYTYYVSFSKRDQDSLFFKFIDDLNGEVGALTGLSTNISAIYIDKIDLLSGDDVFNKLPDPLARSEVAIALLSPAYFDSSWCQQELHAANAAGVPVIKIPWVPTSHVEVSERDLEARTLQLPTEARGSFRHLTRLQGQLYQEALYDLGTRIAEVVRTRRARPISAPEADIPPDVVIPIVAERSNVMRHAPPGQYGMRRGDWSPFGKPISTLIIESARVVGVRVQVLSLERFETWLSLTSRQSAALVLIDAQTAALPKYDRRLTEWNKATVPNAIAIVCTTRELATEINERYASRTRPGLPFSVVTDEDSLRQELASSMKSLTEHPL